MKFFIGLFVLIGTVMGGFMMHGGNPATFWQPSEFIIILGAGVGSMIIGNSKHVLMDLLSQSKATIGGKGDDHADAVELMGLMSTLLNSVRKGGGLKILDNHLENPSESELLKKFPAINSQPIVMNFIIDNLRTLSMDKYLPHEFDAVMEKEIEVIETDMMTPSHALHKTGEAMPGFGILAAVGGIIITMQHLDGPLTEIGYYVAAALVGTFIGIFFCYGIMEPLAASIHERNHKTITLLNSVKSTLVTYQEGKTPLVAVDAGRRMLELAVKPTFAEMEKLLEERDISSEVVNKKSG